MENRSWTQQNQQHRELDAAELSSAITDAKYASSTSAQRDRWRLYNTQDGWRLNDSQTDIEEMAETEAARDWQPELSEAIKRSIEETSSCADNDKGPADAPQPETLPTTTIELQSPARTTIDDRIKEIQSGTTETLSWPDDSNGDTWVFIDPPSQQPEQTPYMHRVYVDRYQKPLIIASATLKAVHSEYFDKLLNSTSQHRIVRRRGLVGKLPDYIKYVIDLTPPAEGNEAAHLMTQLCCVEGVLHWSEAQTRWDIAGMLVAGQDEFTIPPMPGTTPPELSTIRHRSSIERVLAAIRGLDPKMDSAIKVYSTFAVAHSFQITHSPLTDYIVRWLRAPPNSLFIEVLPEVALEMGDGLQCHELIRDSFAVLTGERALDNINLDRNRSFSVHGRKKYDVSEFYQTRLEYASRSFLDRVTQTFAHLVEPDMKWIEKLPLLQAVPVNESGALGFAANELMAALKAYARGAIYTVLYCNLIAAPQPHLGAPGGDCLYPRTDLCSTWDMLDLKERVMTAMFWRALQSSWSPGDIGDSTNFRSWPQRGDEVPTSPVKGTWVPWLSVDRRLAMQQKHGVEEVSRSEMAALVDRMDAVAAGYEVGKTSASDWLARATTEREKSTGFDLIDFYRDVRRCLADLCQKMIGPADQDRNEPLYPDITPTLLSLNESEWRYLPLYAGGFDDGSGGTFNDDVPAADAGFSTAGPSIHTAGSSASSDFDVVGHHDLESTHHTSTVVHDGFSDQLDRHHFYDDESAVWNQNMLQEPLIPADAQSSINVQSDIDGQSTIDAASEDGFVLPLRAKPSNSGVEKPVVGEAESKRGGSEDELDDYSDIFTGNDDDNDGDSGDDAQPDDDDDNDDDAATEKGDDDDVDMVIV
ncbi:MAG: hypothetical protein LQ350_000232 [Teloschistes chrysophthalmus]|nr:MAG: hypothetical protein LQ350_000232 [Niorma chrysophthalma]